MAKELDGMIEDIATLKTDVCWIKRELEHYLGGRAKECDARFQKLESATTRFSVVFGMLALAGGALVGVLIRELVVRIFT